MEIKKIGIFSLANLMGAMHVLMGIVSMGILSIFGTVSVTFSGVDLATLFGLSGFMLFFVVVFFYGVVGWVSGVIFAFVYNVLA
ncbi:MAG: hypothetical protein AAB611_03565, partial [Patescibacteria group bacterium]